MPAQPNPPDVSFPNAMRGHGILSGGLPSDAELREARAAGYKTVINLQLESEDGAARVSRTATELGFIYVSIPVAGAAGVTEENAVALDTALAAAKAPVIVHCAGGNRVGALMAIRAKICQGLSSKAALATGRETGLRGLDSLVRERLGMH